jgi:2-methylisocitrate lyase-like PEP mutase family enzyme
LATAEGATVIRPAQAPLAFARATVLNGRRDGPDGVPRMSKDQPTPPARLRRLLERPGLVVMPCCFDALSARLIEQAGFPLTFMSGFAAAAARLAAPDTGLISYGEMVDQGRDICAAVSIPVIGDGDTGYGNALNVRRTVRGYAAAGFAGIMIEDQVAPKRCGHVRGKETVARHEALMRVRAACDARDELKRAGGDGIVIMARTDANATNGLKEALWRAKAFADIGADILFVEAPRNEGELARIGAEVPGAKMVNMLEGGDTPLLSPARLERLGFKIAAYPLSLMLAAVAAMEQALESLSRGRVPKDIVDFAHLCDVVGFPDYDAAARAYAARFPERPLPANVPAAARPWRARGRVGARRPRR